MARAVRSIAAAVAAACLALGLWAPIAMADATGGAPTDTAAITDGSTGSGGTVAPDTQPTSTGGATGGEQPPAAPPASPDTSQPTGSDSAGGGAGPSDTVKPAEQAAPPDQPAADKGAGGETHSADGASGGTGSATGGGERSDRSVDSDAQRAAGAPGGSGVMITPLPQQSALPLANGIGSPPSSGPTALAELGTIPFGGAGIRSGLATLSTGGMRLLLTSPLACRMVSCYGASAGALGSAVLASPLRDRAAAQNNVSKASEQPLMPFLRAPGSSRGPFFGLLGGGGGGTAGFMLLGLVAVLVGMLVRHRDWTTAFRLPTVVWPPSTYLPPIESPG